MKTILAYSPAPWNHALAMLRIVAPLREAGFQLICGNDNGGIHPERVCEADLVVIQRDFPVHLRQYEEITGLARQQSKPIILDLDDWLLNLPENHPDRISHHYAASLFPLLRALIEANAVTASTVSLGNRLLELNPNTWVLPNYIDAEIWKPRPRVDSSQAGDPITLVYMGGDSHTPDLELVIPVLGEILHRYGERLTLHLVGMQPDERLKDFPNLVCTPFQMDYASYARFAAEQSFDLAIAPLADNAFNRCKSPIKYLEYSALGIPGVYSSITPYADLIRPYENGLLASTPENWLEAIARLIEDPQLRQRIGKTAQEKVRKNWSLHDHAHEWATAYTEIARRGASPNPVGSIPAHLVVDLTRQTQFWQDDLQRQLSEQDRHNGSLPASPSSPDQVTPQRGQEKTSLRDGIASKLNRLMSRISTGLNNKTGT